MNPTGNTILITGGGSGIGRGLAESLHALGNQVIISGRRLSALDETTAANPGIKSLQLDIEHRAPIRAFVAHVIAEFPSINVLINNAGIMRRENLLEQQPDLADTEAIVATNLLGPIRLTAALLPHLQKQPHATIMNVSSGLAFLPMANTPTYCATKAALHSYTLSLRAQLRNTRIEVLELIPPYVATNLMDGAKNPRAMPLDKFIAEAMEILTTQPAQPEICVENVKTLRFAAESGNFDTIFARLNAPPADTHRCAYRRNDRCREPLKTGYLRAPASSCRISEFSSYVPDSHSFARGNSGLHSFLWPPSPTSLLKLACPRILTRKRPSWARSCLITPPTPRPPSPSSPTTFRSTPIAASSFE